MEPVKQIVEQLEEAKGFIKRDTDSCYRIALILIDNCVELMLRAKSSSLLSMYSMHSRMNAQLKKTYTHEQLRERGLEMDELSKRRIQRIRHNFPDKVDYLFDHKEFTKPEADCIKELHNYRNDSYHLNRFNRNTLYAVTLLYFRLSTRCLAKYRLPYVSSQGAKAERYFLRYGIIRYFDLIHEGMKTIAESLAADAILQNSHLADLLSKSVDEYIKRIDEAVDFLAENSGIKQKAQHFKIASYLIANDKFPNLDSTQFQKYASDITHKDSSDWKATAKEWSKLESPEEIYLHYVRLERRIAPIVRAFESLASDLDSAIQLQVDIARGK